MTMSFVDLDHTLEERLARAVTSRLHPASDALRKFLRDTLSRPAGTTGSLLSDPVFEATFDYARASETMHELAGHLLLPELVAALDSAAAERFPRTRQPYAHQLEAWRALAASPPRSALVASGTGSGKTECFLVPIMDDLLRRAATARPSGVQALFLYPLNALIASQQKRLSAWAEPFGARLRFALYNGLMPEEAPADSRRASPCEVRDRRTLRADPAPILVTNTTMLEYLLVRAADRPIVERSCGALRWIVLDEAHTYIGSQAAEMALLIRRVLDAFGVSPSEVRLVATSATIGERDSESLREFLAGLGGIALDRVSLVRGQRVRPELPEPTRNGLPTESERDALVASSPRERFDALAAFEGVQALRRRLASRPERVDVLAEQLDLPRSEILATLDMAHLACADEPLLPLRAHRFVRTLSGMFACIDPRCSGRRGTALEDPSWGLGRVYFERRESCRDCSARVYELALCRQCGAESLLAELRPDGGELMLVPTAARAPDTLEGRPDVDDEDAHEESGRLTVRLVGGAASHEAEVDRVSIGREDGRWDDPDGVVVAVARRTEDRRLQCPRCGHADGDPEAVVAPLFASRPFLLSVALPTALEFSPSRATEPVAAPDVPSHRPFRGRRLIAFNDSRQGSARFAMLLEQESQRRYVQSWLYHQIWSNAPSGDTAALDRDIAALEAIPGDLLASIIAEKRAAREAVARARPSIAWQDAVSKLADASDLMAMERSLRDLSVHFSDRRHIAHFLLLRELLRRPRRQVSLETLGLVATSHPVLERRAAPTLWTRHGGTTATWRDLLSLALDVVRSRNAVEVAPELQSWLGTTFHPTFLVGPDEPQGGRTKMFFSRHAVPPRGQLASVIARHLRLDPTTPEDAASILALMEEVWSVLTAPGVLHREQDGYRLDPRALELYIPHEVTRCPLTGRALPRAVADISPYATPDHAPRLAVGVRHKTPRLPVTFPKSDRDPTLAAWLASDPFVQELRDAGLWIEFSDRIASFSAYYRSQEHSAQLSPSALRRLEGEFERGCVNVLSCSTTMEMGVDIGGLSVVAMNNVPPGPANYLQRAGRAGRRGETASLTLTLCRPSPHDDAVFADPTWPFRTPIAVPRVALESTRIVWRHVHALLLGRFLRMDGSVNATSSTCRDFMLSDGVAPCPADRFQRWLSEPNDDRTLDAALTHLIAGSGLEGADPAVMRARTGASMGELVAAWRTEHSALQDELAAFASQDAARRAASFALSRLEGEFLLKELTARAWLPGHGFPTDLVPFVHVTVSDLQRRSASDARDERDDGFGTWRAFPTRHLAIAISEYAPGAKVVIAGKVYESSGVTLNWRIPPTVLDPTADIQALREASRCRACGLVGDATRRVERCGGCGSDDLERRPYLKPAGFAVELKFEPHNDVGQVGGVPAEPPWVSAGGASWTAVGRGLRWRATHDGRLFHHTLGAAKRGFEICLRCGRAEASGPDGRAPGMQGHSPLRGLRSQRAHGGLCRGNDETFAVQRHRALGGVMPTDVFELQLRAGDEHSGPTSAQAVSLVVALRQALAERLGIDRRELGFGVTHHDWEGRSIAALALFDTAPGGAGYSPRAGDAPRELLLATRDILMCRERACDRACHGCLLAYDTDRLDAHLDRHAALDFIERLTSEMESTAR